MINLKIPETGKTIQLQKDTAKNPKALVILAHGAGAPMSHPFMESLTRELVATGFEVVRFNFPYMAEGRKSPGSPKVNIKAWKVVVEWAENNGYKDIILSGKSYGGRMAAHLLADHAFPSVKGIAFFGFPLHAPGKPSSDRAEVLSHIKIPKIFFQGTKDSLAKFDLIADLIPKLKHATLTTIENGDHSLKVKKDLPETTLNKVCQAFDNWYENCLI